MENNNLGEIYKITNLINNKIYIGKTKMFYKDTKFGYENRFKNHLISAFSKSKRNDCPRLYNAIRKYGKQNFNIELICNCPLEKIDEYEIKYIKMNDSTNDKKGYNIALGGGGRSVVNISEETRKKISLKQSESEMNIKPYLKNNIQIGYTVQRRQNGKVYRKYFSNTKNTLEENYKLSKEFLNSIINSNITDNKYNRKKNLPINIHEIIKDNKIIGYKVFIMKNKIKYTKTFQSSKKSIEELYNNAIEYKKSIIELK